MTGDPVISRFDVLPDYSRGFVFHWEVRPDYEVAGPWQFLVQAAETPEGDWMDISPVLEDVSAWRDDAPLRVSKEYTLYFRLLMRIPSGEVIESGVRTPYGDLGRREFLIGRDVMRIAVLQSRTLAGVEVDAWSSSIWGPRCRCVDPVTGEVRDSHCKRCYGTGRDPGFRGPFRMWADFTPNAQHSVEMSQDGNGVVSQKAFEVKAVTSVPLKKRDVIRDVRSGKMYNIDKVAFDTEIRRVPLMQTLSVFEIPTTDVVYGLGVRNA